MSEWAFRLCEPADAPALAEFVAKNPQIDPADMQAALKSQNPTAVYFCVTKDGKPVAFAPFYCTMMLAHLGFDPDSRADDRQQALEMILRGASAFAVQFGVREIATLSKEKYPVAKWAIAHGFEVDGRQLLRLNLNHIMENSHGDTANTSR